MAVKIILKNSSTEDKRPTPGQLESGEIALNYNDAGAFLTCKDSEGNIQQVGGVKISEVAPDDPVMQTLWFQPSSLELFVYDGNSFLPVGGSGGGGGGGVVVGDGQLIINDSDGNEVGTFTANQATGTDTTITLPKGFSGDYDELNNKPNINDLNYLKLAVDAGDQTVASTGATTFDGLVEAGKGVRVTGGTTDDIDYGIRKDTNNDSIHIQTDSVSSVSVSKTGALGFPGINQRFRMNIGGEIPAANSNTQEIAGIHISPSVSVGDYAGINILSKGTGSYKGVRIQNTVIDAGATAYGIYSDIASQRNSDKFNFFAKGDGPNYLAGSTYIGGDVSRNTFELWKSTLTEEQKEQLAAETLAIPANVSTPGDGEFARQWYYDQQNAETQAELDAGTVDYPTHLAEATFNDTFALGDNTKINLLDSGVVQNDGIQFVNSNTNNRIQSRGIVYSTAFKAFLSVNRPNNAGEDVNVLLARSDNSEFDANGNRIPVNISRATSFKAQNPYGSSNGTYGTYDSYVGFNATDLGNFEQDAEWTGDDDSYGFLSSLSTKTGTGGGQTYNFYADGNASNYFEGDIRCNGLINGAFSLRMETDDPDAFTNTITTDKHGNEVVKSVYHGTTEDLLSIIKDLRARIAALESAAGGASVATATSKKK